MEINAYKLNTYLQNIKIGDVYNKSIDDSKDAVKLKKACQDFESFFVGFMMNKMDDTVVKSNLFSGGRAEEIFSDMKNEAIAEESTKNRGIGIAQMLYKDLTQNSKASLQPVVKI